jgi:hypothetical protein
MSRFRIMTPANYHNHVAGPSSEPCVHIQTFAQDGFHALEHFYASRIDFTPEDQTVKLTHLGALVTCTLPMNVIMRIDRLTH